MKHNRIKNKITVLVLSLIMTVGVSLPFYGAESVNLSEICDSIIAWKQTLLSSDNPGELIKRLSLTPSGQNEGWYITAMSGYEKTAALDYSDYGNNISEIDLSALIPTDVQRIALAAACSGNTGCVPASVFTLYEGEGIMSLIYGIICSASYREPQSGFDTDGAVAALLEYETDDGGWALSGNTADTDVTAMALQALSFYTEKVGVGDAVQRGTELLSLRQLDNGGYKSWGNENPETSAQVALALIALGKDPFTDPDFIKNGNSVFDAMLTFRNEDGGFSHLHGGSSNDRASVQVLLAAVASLRFYAGESFIYAYREAVGSADEDVMADIDESGSLLPQENEGSVGNIEAFTGISAKTVLLLAVGVCGALYIFIAAKKARGVSVILTASLVTAALLTAVILLDIKSPAEYYAYNPELVSEESITAVISVSSPDGDVITGTEYVLHSGESALEFLEKACRYNKLTLDSTAGYVKGINGLYERDMGALSGWVYEVNGIRPGVAASEYRLADGDIIKWIYEVDE